MEKGDLVNPRSKAEVAEYMRCLIKCGDLKSCLNLCINEIDNYDEYKIVCKEKSTKDQVADNTPKNTIYQSLRTHVWPKCPDVCTYYNADNWFNRTKANVHKIKINICEFLKKEPGKVKWIHIGLIFLAGVFVGEFGPLRALLYQVVDFLKRFGFFN